MNVKLLFRDEGRLLVKDIAIFDHPRKLKAVLSEISWNMLKLLSKEELYVMEMARRLGVHEQKIYYHVRKLLRSGIVEVSKEISMKGGLAKYYRLSYPAMGVELPGGERVIRSLRAPSLDPKVENFFSPFIKDGLFDGKIVVGSPDPHGPFKARARDGHYGVHFAFFLGNFLGHPDDFIVKLDVDVKAEKEEKNNLILIGGPGTNLLTEEINDFLPIKFNVHPSDYGYLFGGLYSRKSGSLYTADQIGLISRVPNPWSEDKTIIVLAGNKSVGTKASVLALSNFWDEILKKFDEEEEFATVIQGFDLNGDGKIDSIEVLE